MILVVCGPPGAGKTTVALGLNRRLEADGYDFRVIHTDDLATPVYDHLFERVADAPKRTGCSTGRSTSRSGRLESGSSRTSTCCS